MSSLTPDGHVTPEVPPRAARSRLAVTRDELVAWGEAFGRAAHPPLVVTLAGELGAGKTTLAQAICRGFGVRDDVTSPTYALVHEYRAPNARVFHLDLYRLKHEGELTNIGWDDLLAAEDAIVLVEWPERAGSRLPPHVAIDLEYSADDETRRVLLAG
ncbi:MAG: tRNA (adenosine(37)-N6)-threonylcarbamoyltransferase complex ATPase subunit type 1 TsaE [Gemmatirosa sp.]|nr:tRNA (adenosine(37)-N6)-threonylcarbamoyltransferase complex ATPase subunit type 1 TsaE [Gemmatirosa sp.]